MITTRQINVNLTKGKLKLRQSTTKNIDASIRVEPPKEPIKPRGVSTTTLPDVAEIVEKKRRDDIMAEQKLAIKDAKKIVIEKKKDKQVFSKVNDFPKTPKEVMEAGGKSTFQKDMAIYQNEQNELIAKEKSVKVKAEKKPWNKMNAKERKEHQATKAKK